MMNKLRQQLLLLLGMSNCPEFCQRVVADLSEEDLV